MPTRLINPHDSARSTDSVIGRDGLITEPNAVDTADKSNLGLGGRLPIRRAGYLRQPAINRLLIEHVGDGRTPKKFQKSTSDGNIAFRRPVYDNSLNSTKGLNESKFSVPGRRQSVKDSKTSQGVSTMQSSPSKRSAIHTKCATYTRADCISPAPLGYQRSAATTRLRNQQSGQALGNGTPNIHSEPPTLAYHDDTSNLLDPVDFLPFVNFDDFHESLTSGEHYRDHYQAPDHLQGDLMTSSGVDIGQEHNSPTKIPLMNAGPADSGFRIGRSGSLLRQNSNRTRTNAQPVSSTHPSLAAVGSSSSNPRRKSYFPSSMMKSTTAQSPRKSIGPGSLTQDLDNDLGVGPNIGYPESRSRERDGSNLPAIPRTSVDIPRAPPRSRDTSFPSVAAARQSKTKSLHIPSKSIQDPFSCAFGTPDTTTSSMGTPRPTGRPLAQRTVTPTSSKRMSIMPNSAHATGLAARTISPTDARRLKRMSVMPTAPPLPYTPPYPQTDPPLASEKTAPSPSLVPRKASTPTSSRTTPELKRKSYSSGISNSSTTSYNSCQSFNGPPRIPQSFSSSRLPMLKTRNEPLPNGGEEQVPPVPAIPKAYESPKMEVDHPFFSSRKPSLPYDASSLTSASTAEGLPTPLTDNEGLGLPRKSSLKKKPTNESGQVAEKKVPSMISNNRRTLQPLRLPPLNLLPLSTPTAAKINALFDGTVSASLGTITPPPKVRSVATPTTPMTASRTSFFAKSQQEEDPMPDRAQIRSSSSHYVIRLDPSMYEGSNSVKDTIEAGHASLTRKAVSPFMSASLPKASGEFGYARHHGIFNGTDSKLDGRPSRLTGLHLQKTYKASKDDSSGTEDPSPVDVSTPSFGSSLRRKLSLTRKRSTSKTQSRAESEDEAPPKPPKHDHMPPPKLPASATWSGPLLPSPSPTHKNNQLPTRKKPSKPVTPQHERNRSSTWTANGAPQKGLVMVDQATASAASKRTVRSTLEGGYSSNALSLKDFLKEAKKMETQLDKDDQQAEEEMRRLASKRKDAETAAREIDTLRRRATAKDRLSPNKALRMTNLNIFERGEIMDYRDIYFCGTSDAKKHVGDLNAESTNFGYDDNRGDYNIVPGDHLAYRYEMVDILGKGSFGQVVRCVDHKTGTLVAIKIIRNKKRFHQQALVEVDILQKLRDWVS